MRKSLQFWILLIAALTALGVGLAAAATAVFQPPAQAAPESGTSAPQSGNTSTPMTATQQAKTLSEALPELPPVQEDAFNLLICGIDHTNTLADVVLFARLDIQNKKADILQIPRDLYIGEGYSTGKLNEACLPFTSDNPTQRVEAVLKSQLGLTVDGWAVITMAGVRSLVDALGGIAMEMPQEIEYLPGKVIPMGKVNLNAEQAEWLLRYREGYQNADLGRLSMQQTFIDAVFRRAKTVNEWEAFKIATQCYPYMKTSLSMEKLLSLGQALQGLASEDIAIQTLPVYGESYKELSVLCADRNKVADVINQTVRKANPVDPWELQLAYPPQEPKDATGAKRVTSGE